jgi:type II secretory ATPase GspE/PulE/Tfp pilus assembly ATPase PilB-like protein
MSSALPATTLPPATRMPGSGGPGVEDSFWSRLNGSAGGQEPAAPAPASAQKNTVTDIEELASGISALPVKLPRGTCSIPAENLLRLLGRNPRSAEPWVPVGTLGPLLIMAHCRTDSEDYWGVPSALIVRVIVDVSQYDSILKDLYARIGYKPLADSNPVEQMPAAPSGDPKAALRWFIEHYPLTSDEREKMSRLYEENENKPLGTLEDLKFLPRHYGAAVMRIATGHLAFNPEEAPGQNMFPDTLLDKHTVFPLFCGRRCVYLMSAVASNYAFEDEWLSGGNDPVKIIPVLSDPAAIRAAIARNRSKSARDNSGGMTVGELSYSDTQQVVEIDPVDISRVNPANPNNTAEQLVQWAIYRALTMRASDLHIEKFYNTARFRARIDGELVVIHSCSEESLPRYIAMIKNWANLGQERQTCQDGRFAMRIGQRRVDVRVAAVPHRKEFQKIIMRFLDKQDGIRKLSELNLGPRQTSIIKSVMGRDQGLVLVTGPTGSGKTTTLYAFLNSINDDNINIQTIEDPIEYEIEGINQTQTDPFHDLTFAAGLRSLLRADPDVILIGESRDGETAGAAINAALTGHLVLTTLHANDSLRAISRLLSMNIEPYLLADALCMSQAQRLVRRLCPYCKHPMPANQEVQDFLYYQGIITEPLQDPIYQKVGCEECNGTGYTGRIALMEIALITTELSTLIATGAPVNEMRKIAVRDGFKSLYQEGLIQVVGGHTTFDEINCLSYTAME